MNKNRKLYLEIVSFIRSLYNQPSGSIPLHAPTFKGNEIKYLIDCIDSTYVSSVGEYVDKFEIEIAKYTGVTKAVSCVNGTNALHLSLLLMDVEPGTEVITQPLTFVATSNAISYCGARPLYLDVDIDTLGLSPIALKNWLEQNAQIRPYKSKVKNNSYSSMHSKQAYNKKTGRRISCCVPMHTFGHPCRIDQIIDLCNQYFIPVIEDAAESLGSFYKNKHTGTYGNIGVLSFNGNKIITTGGGGMLLFKDEELAKKAKHLTTQAKVPHPWDFYHDEIGFNYRMPNINAALGLAQMEQLDYLIDSKRKLAGEYKSFFTNKVIKFFNEPEYAHSNFWLNAIIFENIKERNEFLKLTNENGIMTRPCWRLMHKLPMFEKSLKGKLSNVEWIEERLANIPSSVQ